MIILTQNRFTIMKFISIFDFIINLKKMLKGLKIKKKQEIIPKKKWQTQNDFKQHINIQSFKQIHQIIYEQFLGGQQIQLKESFKKLAEKEHQYFKSEFQNHEDEKQIFKLQNFQQVQQNIQNKKYEYEYQYEQKEPQKNSKKRRHQEQRIHKFLPSQKVISNCIFCPENEQLVILSSSQNAFLAMVKKKQYQKYHHFYICPVEHIPSSLLLQNFVYDQIINFKKCLISLFDSLNLHAIFFQSYFQRNSHLNIECLVIPSKKAHQLPFYFKQGLTNSQGDWNTNPKIIDIRKQKGGLLKQLPKKFRYFYIDFTLGYGYAHIIQQQQYWNLNFAHQILATLLGMQKHQILTSEQYTQAQLELKKKNFLTIWKQYDWTTMI